MIQHLHRLARSLALLALLACPTVTWADDASGAKSDAPAGDAGANAVSSSLEQFKQLVLGLDLTDAQKGKIDTYFESAQTQFAALGAEPDSADRQKKIHAISVRLRHDVSAALTPEQKAALAKKPATVDATGPMIERIKAELNKPDSKLTDAQKTQVNEVLDVTKKQIEDLQQQARESKVDVTPKVQQVIQNMKRRLAAILASDKKQ